MSAATNPDHWEITKPGGPQGAQAGAKGSLMANIAPAGPAGWGYLLRDQDLGKIHRAASRGKVAKVQQILLLGKNGVNDKDKKSRTALHLACANGYAEVVTLLVERKCQLNLYDGEQRTALMKAIQCKEEECATILLQHGADPDIVDACGNTALHYAACAEHIPLAAKLLSYNANIEARNKDDLTPLLLAVDESKQQMVEFLVKKGANIHAVDKSKSCHQLISEYKEKKLLMSSSQNNNPEQLAITQETLDASLQLEEKLRLQRTLLSNKPGIDDSWPTSDEEDFNFDTKTLPKPSLTKLMTASQQFRKNTEENHSIVRRENRTLLEDNSSDSEHEEDVVETFPKLPVRVQGLSHAAFPSPDPLLKPPLESSAVPGATKVKLCFVLFLTFSMLFPHSVPCILLIVYQLKDDKDSRKKWSSPSKQHYWKQEGTTKLAIIEKEAGIGITESAPREQTNSGNMTSVVGAHKDDRSDMMSALELGEEEDIESSWDSESISESLPQKCVAHLSEVTDQKGKNILNGQIEDVFYIPSCMSGSRNFKMAKLEDTRNVGIPVAHMDSPEKYPHVKPMQPIVEMKDSAPNKAVRIKDVQTSKSAELDLKMKSEEEQERLDGSENNQPQVEEERKKHRRSEMEVSENLYAAAEDDEDGFIQQRKSEKTDSQQFPIKDNDSNRLSNKPGIDDPWPTSDKEDFDFDTKTLPKPSLTKLMTAYQQFRKNIEENSGIVRPENRTLLEDSSSDIAHKEDVDETLPKLPVRVRGLSHAAFPSPDPLLKPPLESSAVPGATKEGTRKPAIIEKEAGIGITESAPREQTNSGNMTSVVGAHKDDRSDMMPALGLGEKEDIESPWDSESISESLPQKYVAHLSEVTDQKGKNILNGQIEDVFYIPSCMSGSRNFKMAKLEDTRNVGIPVAHMDSPEKYPHVKPMQPINEMKDSAPNKAVRIKDVQTSKSDFSDWDSTSLTLNSEHCKTSGDLKVDDKCLFVSQSITKNQSASTECGQMTLIDKEKFSTGTIFLLENYSLHDPCESQLSEKKESKEELDLKMKSEEEQERLDGSENNQPQVEEERKKHKRSEMEVSENLYAAAEDGEDGFIQQRKSEKTDSQQFPIKD
ncbi:ankyrin repeat domain-containing protein 26-like, partial [Choloepus didactylus]|uniref:ankyrin repeat domain-containing protein 26-like n=1 Tax=Choloepus didactylus TaxID=27675 RepID=UPI0018A0F152